MQKTTENTFKMLYIIAILMIVDGHIGHFDYLNFHNLLRYQNYHIALFMFASGYFLNLKRNYKEFFIRKITRLILPLYLWNFIYGFICFILNNYFNFNIGGAFNWYNLLYAPWVDGHQFIYNMASWFLIPLFLVQVIAFILLKPFADKSGKIPLAASVIFFITALCCGLASLKFGPQNEGERNLTLMILRVFYFIPSFALGLLYRRKLSQYDTLSTPLYCFILLSITTLLCVFFPKYDHIPSWLSRIEEPPIVIYAICFTAILFWLRIAKVLSPLLEQSNALQNIADHTFDIMMHHFAGFMLIKATLSGLPNFNLYAFKNNIWYDFFPVSEDFCAWGYIFITIVIALLTGFTSRWFYDRIKQLFYRG